MKKIIVGMLAFVFLFTGIQSVFASGPFNGQSGDCPNIAIGNYTTGTGIADGQWNCWTRQSVSASAGDTINVALFYHNNTSSTLTNVGATLSQSSNGPTTSYSFSGQMYSDQGSTSLGTVSLNLNSSQTLTYSSAHWMKDKNAINSDTDSAMLYGQTGSVMRDGGQLKVGNVPPGWNDYGYILVVFKVGSTVTPQLCMDQSAANYGQPLPCQPQPSQCSASLSASRTQIVSGESSQLSWTLSNCTGVTVYPTIGNTYSSDSRLVSPTASTVYTLNANSSNGTTVIRTVTINVTEPARCLDTSATNYGSYGSCTYAQKCLDSSATNYLSYGSCTYAQKCLDTSANNYGSYGSCTYTQIRCLDSRASNYLSYTTCTYDRVRCLDSSASNYLDYSSCTYAQKCLDSSATNYLSYGSCTYAQKCLDTSANNYGSYGSCTYTQRCNDSSANNYGSRGSCTYDRVRCLDSSASNYLDYSSCSYNRVRCLDSSASNYLDYSSCVYNRQTCTDRSANNYGSYGSCTYTQVRCLDSSATNYLSYASCIYNQVRCLDQSASNYLAYNSCVYNVVLNKNVVTTVATNIAQSQAQLNGYITNTTFYNSSTYFNYGTTVDMGSRTTAKSTSGTNSFSDYISGLSPNTIYFFQAVGETSAGTSKGSIEVFKTLGNGVVKPIIIQGTTIVGTESPIELSITNKYELIGQNDLVDYVVTYKNIGKTKLTKPMVQVVLPSNFTLVNASRGTYSVDTHTLSALIEDLDKGQSGVIYLQAKVDSVPANNAQIVTTAILVYTNTNNAQENAMAYALNTPKVVSGNTTDNNLGANAFLAGLVSIGLIGWLLITLVILLLVLIVHSVYSKPNNTNVHTPTH